MAALAVPLNDLKRQTDALAAELLEATARVVTNGYYLLGPELAAFEREFAMLCDGAAAIGVASGTDALLLALLALGCGPGDEVATVANAGMYATTAILAAGARPVFVDIDPATLNMSPQSLAERLTPETRAVVVTHLYGRMADIRALLRVTEVANVPIVEDCAQACGARLDGRAAGAWGRIGCFSFYPTKNLGALGDAGMVVTSDATLAEVVSGLRQYGWREKYHAVRPRGRNSRLDELQAAALRVKLPYLTGWNERRRAIVRAYQATTAGLPLDWPEGDDSSFVAHLCVICCDRRNELRAWLKSEGIVTDVHYPTPDYGQPAVIAQIGQVERLPETERATDRVLTLPCFPELADDEVRYVGRSIRRFYEHTGVG